MEKIWLKSYLPGIPETIDAGDYTSLKDMIERHCKMYADRLAYACMGSTMTYAQLDQRSAAFAAWLQQQGLQKGDRVALMMPNILQYPVALFGVLRAGFAAVNVNPLYTTRVLPHHFHDSGARIIVILAEIGTSVRFSAKKFRHDKKQIMPQRLELKRIKNSMEFYTCFT
ncbi:MAG: AMP-binding protein, partial [Pseudomonadota bacterium]